MGFHASQETARVLGESIDYAHKVRWLPIAARMAATTQPAPFECLTSPRNSTAAASPSDRTIPQPGPSSQSRAGLSLRGT